ncbi:MAG: TonB-dependent receptor, partial [Gemmatimonadales bacterium]
TGSGTLTDRDGRYRLPGLEAGEVEIRVAFLGYATQVRQVTVPGSGQVVLDFLLSEEALSMDGIVVTGTAGQARRREVGNAVAQLDVSRVDQPSGNVDALLQGRIPAVSVTPPAASFGSGASIRIRGNSSAALSNQPIIFVDGVRQSAEAYPLNASSASFPHYGPGARPTPLNDINPADIERIEVVKGPAAATLYGSEASAGVIQIFTKRGTQGGARWTLQSDHSVDWVKPFGSADRPFIGLDPWLRRAYGTRNTLSVTGGVQELRYFVSAGLDGGEGVLPNDADRRRSFRANLNLGARDDLELQLNVGYTKHDLEITHTGNSGMALPFNAFRAPNNSFGSSDPAVLSQLLDAEVWQENERLTYGLSATWAPHPRVTQRLTTGVDRTATISNQLRPLGFPLEPAGAISDIRWVSSTVTTDYLGSVRWWDRDVLASTFSWGGQGSITDESTVDSYGRGFPGPGRQTLSSVAERWVSGSESRVVSGGLFVQNLVGIRDRVFLTGAVRIDGHSTFGRNLGLLVYPKASASWVVSDEAFWPGAGGTLKLRAAYGRAGRAPGAFDAQRTWSAISFGGESAFLPGNVGNPDLGPERSREVEVGFDGAWFDDRLTADLTFYDQVTEDGLVTLAEIPSNGFGGGALVNLGELTNRGLEVAIRATPVVTPSLSWTVGATLATNRSRITDLGGVASGSTEVGQPVGAVRGTRVLNAGAHADPEVERNALFGPSHPTREVGLNTTLELPRGVRLVAAGEYQAGHYIADNASAFMIDRGNGAPACDAAYRLVPFGSDLGSADLSGLNALDRARCYRGSVSGAWVYPADFFKLRELTLVVPVGVVVPAAGNAQLTFSLRNALRWTNRDFGAFDPEMVSSRANTSALNRGITEHAPAPARFVTSIRIGF